MSITSIDVEVAEELLCGNSDGDYGWIAQEFQGESRWTIDYVIVFTYGDNFYAFSYSDPATEDQEGMDAEDVFGGDPVPVWQVEPVVVETVEYRQVK